MTLEEIRLHGRIAQLENALANYARVVELTSFRVEGDLRRDYLAAYGDMLVALPADRRPPKPLTRAR